MRPVPHRRSAFRLVLRTARALLEAPRPVRIGIDRRFPAGNQVKNQQTCRRAPDQPRLTVPESEHDVSVPRRRSDHWKRIGCRRPVPHPDGDQPYPHQQSRVSDFSSASVIQVLRRLRIPKAVAGAFLGAEFPRDGHPCSINTMTQPCGLERPCCMDRMVNVLSPSYLWLSDADGLRAFKLEHAVRGSDGDRNFSCTTPVSPRAQRVTDHSFEAIDGRLHQGSLIVPRPSLPAHTPMLSYAFEMPIALGRSALCHLARHCR